MNFFSNTNNHDSLHTNEELGQLEKNMVCWWPWIMLTIHSDGTTQPCCYYYKSPVLGNVLRSRNGISELWNSEILKNLRMKMISRGKNYIDFCKNCDARFGFQRKIK